MVVASDDDALRVDADGALLDLDLTVVLIGPEFHMLGSNLVLTEFLNDHCVLSLVIVPPLSVGLDESIGECSAYVTCLAGAGSSDVPLVFSLVELGSGVLEEVVDLLRLHKLGNVHKSAVTSVYALGDALLNEELVLLSGVSFDILRSRRDTKV